MNRHLPSRTLAAVCDTLSPRLLNKGVSVTETFQTTS